MKKPIQITRFQKAEFLDLVRQLDRENENKIFEPQLPLDRLSKRVSESVTLPAKEPAPECTTCGVCCDALLIVPITKAASERFSEFWDIVPDETAPETVIERVLPRDTESGRCIHLAGKLGSDISCRIYADRPTPCRDFEVGSDRCHGYRRLYGFENPLSRSAVKAAVRHIESTKTDVITYSAIVVESTGWRAACSGEPSGGVTTVPVTYLRVAVIVDDREDDVIALHSYEVSEEEWCESDFLGLTIEEAESLIKTKVCQD